MCPAKFVPQVTRRRVTLVLMLSVALNKREPIVMPRLSAICRSEPAPAKGNSGQVRPTVLSFFTNKGQIANLDASPFVKLRPASARYSVGVLCLVLGAHFYNREMR